MPTQLAASADLPTPSGPAGGLALADRLGIQDNTVRASERLHGLVVESEQFRRVLDRACRRRHVFGPARLSAAKEWPAIWAAARTGALTPGLIGSATNKSLAPSSTPSSAIPTSQALQRGLRV